MLEARGLLAACADQELFSNLTFSVAPGQWCAVQGENGQGKSTLLKLLAGLLPRMRGSRIAWQGKEVDRFAPDFLQDLVYVGHTPPLHPALTAEENLQWLMRIGRSGTIPSVIAIREALLSMRVIDPDIPSGQLSFGQRQRVSLARLPLSLGKFWLLDEPCTGLDAGGQECLEQCLVQHLSLGGVAVIASHTAFKHLALPKVVIVLNGVDTQVNAEIKVSTSSNILKPFQVLQGMQA